MRDWSSIPKQTVFSEFAGGKPGELGDCWRCCIAAILDMPAAEVPHFIQIAEDNGKRPECDTDKDGKLFVRKCRTSSHNALTQRWLRTKGYVLVTFMGAAPWGDGTPWVWYSPSNDEGDPPLDDIILPFIATGPTVRSKKSADQHAVVMTSHMVYDPHPSNAGLLAVTQRDMIIPITAIHRP